MNIHSKTHKGLLIHSIVLGIIFIFLMIVFISGASAALLK